MAERTPEEEQFLIDAEVRQSRLDLCIMRSQAALDRFDGGARAWQDRRSSAARRASSAAASDRPRRRPGR